MLLFTAAPYGYGPTSKVLCVAEELAGCHEMVYVGMEPGISLANGALFSEVIEVADRDTWNPDALRALERSELLVSSLEYRALPLAAQRGTPSVFLDTLLWLRDSPPTYAELAQAYIAQRFPHPGSGAADYLGKCLQSVGPILPVRLDQPCNQRAKGMGLRVLVCVGGLRSPAMVPQADLKYIQLILSLLQEGLPPYAHVQLALPQYLKNLDIPALAEAGYALAYPTQQQFYEMLEASDVLITTPGLEVVYEAIAVGVPLIFLPPYNATQFVQSRTYSSLNIALHSIEPSWVRAQAAQFHVATSNILNEITRRVQILNADLMSDRDQLFHLGQELAERLGIALATPESLEKVAVTNRHLFDVLGRDGRKRAADTISSVVSPAKG